MQKIEFDRFVKNNWDERFVKWVADRYGVEKMYEIDTTYERTRGVSWATDFEHLLGKEGTIAWDTYKKIVGF
jgi:hypothetical protein